jgi:hypothetical protein
VLVHVFEVVKFMVEIENASPPGFHLVDICMFPPTWATEIGTNNTTRISEINLLP